jgi:hypothetical protein
MPTIEVDFETFKEITARRRTESMTEGDVVREALGIAPPGAQTDGALWHSEGAAFAEGTKLRHVFRSGRIVTAEISRDGVVWNGRCFKGMSPAAASSAGHQANGWQFWEVQMPDGRWVKADSLRRR